MVFGQRFRQRFEGRKGVSISSFRVSHEDWTRLFFETSISRWELWNTQIRSRWRVFSGWCNEISGSGYFRESPSSSNDERLSECPTPKFQMQKFQLILFQLIIFIEELFVLTFWGSMTFFFFFGFPSSDAHTSKKMKKMRERGDSTCPLTDMKVNCDDRESALRWAIGQ